MRRGLKFFQIENAMLRLIAVEGCVSEGGKWQSMRLTTRAIYEIENRPR